MKGCFNEMTSLNGMPGLETPEFMLQKIDDFGTENAYNHYSVGWAHAMCTPYQWTKQVASHWGGTRNGTIVHWPNGFDAKGEVRSQFHHVVDVAQTILEVAGLPAPEMVNGIAQAPFEGVSMAYSFGDAQAPDRHELQYFEMFGNRGLYHQGWTAVTKHSTPWLTDPPPPFDDGRLGALRARRLDAGARRRRRERRQAGRAPAALADRGDQVQRPAARRPPVRADQPRHRRAAAAHHRQQPAALQRDAHHRGVGHQHQEQVPLRQRRGDGPGRRRRRRHHHAGRAGRRMEPLRQGREAPLLLQLLRHPALHRRVDRRRSRRGAARSAWSSPTTAAAWPAAAT